MKTATSCEREAEPTKYLTVFRETRLDCKRALNPRPLQPDCLWQHSLFHSAPPPHLTASQPPRGRAIYHSRCPTSLLFSSPFSRAAFFPLAPFVFFPLHSTRGAEGAAGVGGGGSTNRGDTATHSLRQGRRRGRRKEKKKKNLIYSVPPEVRLTVRVPNIYQINRLWGAGNPLTNSTFCQPPCQLSD